MSTLCEALGAIETLKGSQLEMHGLDVKLDVSEVLLAAGAGAGRQVSGVVLRGRSFGGERVTRGVMGSSSLTSAVLVMWPWRNLCGIFGRG